MAALDFAIIGAQKSASTYLHRVLQAHRQIDMPTEESRVFEDPWFGDDVMSNLEALFGAPRADLRRGIKRPDHLADPLVPARLVAAAPRARVLVVLREPVARAISAYLHYVRLGFLPPLPLGEGFARILDGSLGRTYPRANDVVGYGLYARHLGRWLAHVPQERVSVLAQRDLFSDPATQIAEVLAFLDVAVEPAADLVAATALANPSTYSPARIRLQRLNAVVTHDFTTDRYRRTRRRLGPARATIAASAVLLDRAVLARWDHSSMPRLDDGLAAELRSRYADDEAELTRLFGRRFW